MTISFDLLTEPWVRVVTVDGEYREVSLREAVLHADRFAHLADPDAGVECAILRLLIAIVHAAAFREREPGDELPMRGKYPYQQIAGYLETVKDCFDLFSPTRPFMQRLEAKDIRTTTPYALAAPFLAGEGSKVYVPNGAVNEHDTLTPANAARYLIAIQAWGGGQNTHGKLPEHESSSTKAGVLAGSMSAYPVGDTLADTLLMNITLTRTSGKPIWEVESGHPPEGWLGRLAWPSRSYLLVPNADGQVHRLHFTVGYPEPEEDGIRDSHRIYCTTKKPNGYVRGDAKKIYWRDLPAIYGWDKDEGCPQVNDVAQVLAEQRQKLGRIIIYARDNVGTNEAKINQRWDLVLPPLLLCGDPNHATGRIVNALKNTEKASILLQSALQDLYPKQGSKTSDRAASQLWTDIETDFFTLIDECIHAESENSVRMALRKYSDSVHNRCLEIFDREAASLPPRSYGARKAQLLRDLGPIKTKITKELTR